MRKLGDDVRAEEGRALARLGDGGWDPLIQSGRRDGRFADELVEAAAEAVRTWRAPVRWVTAVPSQRSGDLVPDFAQRLAATLGLPFHPVLERVADNPPQREMTNSVQQVANVRGAFAVTPRPAARGVPARRRHPLQRVDAGDDRGPAAPQGLRPGLPARPIHGVLNGVELQVWSDRLCSGSAGASPTRCSRATLKRPNAPSARRWTAGCRRPRSTSS